METTARLLTIPLRVAMALFALYAVVTVPSLVARWGASPAGAALLVGWIALATAAWPIARGRVAPRTFWVLAIVVAILLRLAALAAVADRTPVGDPLVYLQLARRVLAGGGLAFPDPLLRTEFVALYPPVYPLLLAGLGAIAGLGQGVVWASNVALDLAAALLLARIGAQCGQGGAGRAAAWLCVVWPPFVLAAPLAQKEPLVLVLVLGIVAVLLGARDRAGGWRAGAGLGVLAALLALTQPGLALFPAVVAVALLPLLGWRRLVAIGWRAAPIAIAVMLPWWVRNAMLLHQFVPLTSTAGLGLWIGNNPAASGNWMALPASYARMGEIAMSARAAAEAQAWIAGHPIDFVRLTATKLVRAMGVEQFTVLRFSGLSPAVPAGLAPALLPLCQGALAGLLGAVALVGGRVRRAGGEVALMLAVAGLAQILLFGVWFEFGERHRYFLMPFLFLIVGHACGSGTGLNGGVESRPREDRAG